MDKNVKKEALRERIYIIAAAVLLCVAIALVILLFGKPDGIPDETETSESDSSFIDTEETSVDFYPVDTEIILDETSGASDTSENSNDGIFQPVIGDYEKIDISNVDENIGNGLTLLSFGIYNGEYIENGEDCEVKGVAAAEVRNDGDKNIQYAEITVTAGDDKYFFKLTTLPKGSSVLLFENEKKEYDPASEPEYALSDSVAVFMNEMSLMPDRFKITGTDGFLNITNITDKDFNGTVTVYFKQTRDGKYFGGITYSSTFTKGIKAGKSETISAKHFELSSCKVMFVTVKEN